ncbi:phosphatase PAP2 family protein [Comamonas guangdongensis]|uniref:Phosphatase PAP2 family protein n=1 Tax=Comamonas guangdongensis TaxID=510515 RepID=A0ABV3ZXL6_9BURK
MSLMQGIADGRRFISAGKLAPVLFLAALAGGEAAWIQAHKLVFVGTEPVLWATLVLISISAAYGLTGRSRALSEMSYYAALWVVAALIGAILTYLCATLNLPLLDEEFTNADLALGFHWLSFYAFVREHRLVATILTIAYFSGLPQIFFSIIYLAHIGRSDRNDELWWSSTIALVLTSLLSGLFPAGGTLFYYSIGLENAVHLPHFLALRDGSMTAFSFDEMKGIVTFPSFHTTTALLLIYVYRQLGIFRWVLALNVLMLISTPINGGHYLVDMIGGGAVTVCSIYLMQRVRFFLNR